jgi:hypothetical protein
MNTWDRCIFWTGGPCVTWRWGAYLPRFN